jgi:hypothetical protein
MNTKMQRTISGVFRGRESGAGVWQLKTDAAGGCEITLVGAEPGADDLLRSTSLRSVAIAWQSDGVSVTLVSAAGPRHLRGRAAIIHEPLARLYEALPLVSLDDRARRFWRRVFCLVRIPGGRRLLGLIARRAGGHAASSP